MRHPRDMGAAEVEAFLTMLAADRHVSASTHNQALSALLFLYREVLGVDLPWLAGVNRPTQKRRIPSVLTREEVASLFHVPGRRNGTARPEWRHARALWGTDHRAQRGGVERRHHAHLKCHSARPIARLRPRDPSL